METLVCYCFGYSAEDIVQDAKEAGRSRILERILAAKKDGECRCAEHNPKKR